MEDSIVDTKRKTNEVNKIEEDLTRQLQEKIEICQRQELKILSLKEDLDKTTTQLKINSKIENKLKKVKSLWKKKKRIAVIHVFAEDPIISKNQEKLLLRDIL